MDKPGLMSLFSRLAARTHVKTAPGNPLSVAHSPFVCGAPHWRPKWGARPKRSENEERSADRSSGAFRWSCVCIEQGDSSDPTGSIVQHFVFLLFTRAQRVCCVLAPDHPCDSMLQPHAAPTLLLSLSLVLFFCKRLVSRNLS